MSLTTEALHELFYYKDGKLFNKISRSSHAQKDTEAGTKHNAGYVAVGINNKKYLAHRVIYMMHHGHIPSRLDIDHINGDRADNRIENLRLVTRQENAFNRKRVKGCTQAPSGKWQASIRVDDCPCYLGSFDSREEAIEAYLNAKKHLHKIEER